MVLCAKKKILKSLIISVLVYKFGLLIFLDCLCTCTYDSLCIGSQQGTCPAAKGGRRWVFCFPRPLRPRREKGVRLGEPGIPKPFSLCLSHIGCRVSVLPGPLAPYCHLPRRKALLLGYPGWFRNN